jgi:hypothetical protein
MIVQETGTQLTGRKVLHGLKPTNLWRKGWRWLRDRRHVANGEAKFFGETNRGSPAKT